MRPQEWASRPASWYVRFSCGCSGALLTELIQRWLHWQASGSFIPLGANDLAGALLLVLIAGCLAWPGGPGAGLEARSRVVDFRGMVTLPDDAVRLLERAGVELAVLFGSEARGRAGPASDLDIGIQLVPGGALSLRDRLDLAVALERLLRREVDLVLLDEASPLLRHEAAGGRPLYQRRPGGFGRFVGRAVLEMDDVRPHLLRGGRGMLRKLREAR